MIDYKKVGALAEFMVKVIASYPSLRYENEGEVRWDYVYDHCVMQYPYEFDVEMFEEAVNLILEAAMRVDADEETPTIH